MSRFVDSRSEKIVASRIAGDGALLTNITLDQVCRYGSLTARKVVLRDVATDGTTFGISNTNPTDTLSVGDTFFVKNSIGKIVVNGTVVSSAYDVSAVSTQDQILVNDGGMMKGTKSLTGDFSMGGRLSVGQLVVTSGAQNNQLLFSNGGSIEGTPITYQPQTQETIIPGTLKILGGLTVLGNVSQFEVENVFIDDPILEIASNSLNNTSSGLVIQRPSGNVAISYQADNTLNMSYTTGGAGGIELPIDTSKSLPIKIQGTLNVTGETIINARLGVSQINFI
jgi:hypothetical protein